jgi:hypothetical protein
MCPIRDPDPGGKKNHRIMDPAPQHGKIPNKFLAVKVNVPLLLYCSFVSFLLIVSFMENYIFPLHIDQVLFGHNKYCKNRILIFLG